MKMEKLINRRKLSSDNRGIAMVSVMIVATVCLLVATIVLEMTYTSLLSRKVYTKANDNLYSAEAAVDDMESVLQSIAVYSVKQNQLNTSESFIDIAEQSLLSASGASNLDDHDSLADYIYSQLDDEYKKSFGTVSGEAGSEVYSRDDDKFTVTAVKRSTASAGDSSGSLAITVSFEYEDDKGFVSKVSTDLVLNDITKRKTASDYSIGSYSMFTGGGVTFSGNDSSGNRIPTYVQEGNAYIGTMADNAPTAVELSGVAVYMTGATIVNGDVYLKNTSVLNFTAGADDSGGRTEVTIKGTVYIDSTSVLVISDEIDFMCKDIVIVNGASEKSVFDAGTGAYTQYDDTISYKKCFPYDVSDPDNIQSGTDNSITINTNTGYSTDGQKKTSGCVMISSGNNAYIAKWNGTSWKLLNNGSEQNTSAIINHNPLCLPTAKTTIWTYDNKEVVVDSELAKFVNVQLLYFQRYTVSNTSFHAQYAQVIGHDATTSLTKISVPLDLGGAQITRMTSLAEDTTSELFAAGKLSNPSNSSNLMLSSFGLSDITLNGRTISNVFFKVGNVQDCAENIPNDSSSVLLSCTWGAYTIQNSGTNIGILISADRCNYKALGKYVTRSCSILNAKGDANATARVQIDDLFNGLQYVTFTREPSNSTQYGVTASNGFYYNYVENYQLTMLDNLFVGGMLSFTSDGGGSSGGSITMDSNSAYDFISVENWTQY